MKAGWVALADKENARIIVKDTASPFVREAARFFPREFGRALKSTGFMLQRKMKYGIKVGRPGGQPYQPFSPVTERLKENRPDTEAHGNNIFDLGKHTPLGKLYPATRYKYHADSQRVVIGWVSESAQYYGDMQQSGKTTVVTDKMRKYFFAIGIPLVKNTIDLPQRVTVPAVYDANAAQIPLYVERKLWDSLERTIDKQVGA